MEKLTIKPWQVMQAHENGAEIDFSSSQSECFSLIKFPSWDFGNCVYRIANLTSDGMRLDELVENYPDGIRLEKSEYFDGLYKTSELIKTLIAEPSFISEIKVKQDKKLRPWTMFEFEEHFGEPFRRKNCSKDGDVYRCLGYNKTGVLFPLGINILFEDLFNDYTRFDGSPCGVIE